MSRKSTLVFIASVVLLTAAGEQASAHGSARLVNGQWLIDGELRGVTMYMVDGVLLDEPPSEIDGTIDLDGGIVVPPLGDAHNHALADEAFDEVSARMLAKGIFYVQNPNSVRTWSLKAREKAAAPETADVTYAMGGLTSTGGHPSQIYDRAAAHIDGWSPERMAGEAYVPIDDEADLEAAWPRILEASPDLLKTVLERSEHHEARRYDPAWVGKRGLDPELLPLIVGRAKAEGLRVTTHVTSAADFRVAVAAGVDEISHLPLEPISDEDAAAAAAADVVVVTTTLSHRPADEVDDLEALHAANLRRLVDHGVRLVLGTDSDRSVLDEADQLVRLGLDTAEVLRLATVDTPRWIFPDRDLGRLGAGAEASFAVLRADPREGLDVFRDPVLLVKQGHIVDRSAADEKPGVGQALMHTLMREGTDAAIVEYRRLRTDEPDAWDFSEGQLNALGYAALQHGNTEAAVAIFRLNADEFPTSSNVWDSLGDGLLEAGQRDEARRSFERALELDPGAAHTREKLEALGPGSRDRP